MNVEMRSLRTDEAGVKGAGESDVGCALDDGAAIGEESEGMGRTLEAEKEVIETDVAMGCEAIAHGIEIYGTVVLVDLNGVASTEGNVGTAFTG